MLVTDSRSPASHHASLLASHVTLHTTRNIALRCSLFCCPHPAFDAHHFTHNLRRDVIFQSNPFDFTLANASSGALSTHVIFAAEDDWVSIGSEHWNSMWIRDCYGNDVLQQLKHYTISCAGTTIGPLPGVYFDIAVLHLS